VWRGRVLGYGDELMILEMGEALKKTKEKERHQHSKGVWDEGKTQGKGMNELRQKSLRRITSTKVLNSEGKVRKWRERGSPKPKLLRSGWGRENCERTF